MRIIWKGGRWCCCWSSSSRSDIWRIVIGRSRNDILTLAATSNATQVGRFTRTRFKQMRKRKDFTIMLRFLVFANGRRIGGRGNASPTPKMLVNIRYRIRRSSIIQLAWHIVYSSIGRWSCISSWYFWLLFKNTKKKSIKFTHPKKNTSHLLDLTSGFVSGDRHHILHLVTGHDADIDFLDF